MSHKILRTFQLALVFVVFTVLAANSVLGNNCSNTTAVENSTSETGLISDCNALLEFKQYFAGNDTTWNTNVTNWNTDTPLDDWKGINVTNKRVVKLFLRSGSTPNVSKPIPIDILLKLEKLEVLTLSSFKLNGTISPELGTLSNLWELTLWYNNLSGTIPEELGSLSKLRNLYLNHNNLSGPIPDSFKKLTKLETLRIENNNLTGCIPANLKITRLMPANFTRCEPEPEPTRRRSSRRRSSSSSGGGGGGGIITGTTLYEGTPNEFQIKIGQTSIDKIKVTANRNITNVILTAGKLSTEPSSVKSSPDAEVLEYIQITARNIDDNEISSSSIIFTLSKGKIPAGTDITLLGYNKDTNEWKDLKTQIIEETSTNVTFSAQTDGFSYSPFVIAAMKTQVETPRPLPIETDPPVQEEEAEPEPKIVPQEEIIAPLAPSNTDKGSAAPFIIVAMVLLAMGIIVFYIMKKKR